MDTYLYETLAQPRTGGAEYHVQVGILANQRDTHVHNVGCLGSMDKKPRDQGHLFPNYPYLGYASSREDLSALVKKIEDAAVQRLGIIQDLYGEIANQSLDSYLIVLHYII